MYYLQPLVCHVLKDIIICLFIVPSFSDTILEKYIMEQQFALTLSLLKLSPLLDNATKTESILTLLSLNYNTTDNDNIQNDQHMII